MYAVIMTGGKQYRVAAGDKIAVEKLPGEAGETSRHPLAPELPAAWQAGFAHVRPLCPCPADATCQGRAEEG